MFKKRTSIEQVEESLELAPKFNSEGLIVVTTIENGTNEVLMTGYMNREALEKTILSREAHYFSRSRNEIWHKGAKSGYVQKISQIFIDDDQDAIILYVDIGEKGASCHVGYKSCFYRKLELNDGKYREKLIFTERNKTFNPKKIYGNAPNPTKL